MKKLSNLLVWINDNILKLLIVPFIFIAPLYPKLPFIDLEYTYISIRLEDLYVTILVLVFAIQLFRKKVQLPKNFSLLFFLFWGAVFLSFLFGAYIQNTIPVTNIGFLHAARRIEYMSVFFIAFSTVRTKKDFFLYLYLIVFVLVLVSLYGVGQKFFGFPAVSTMNPEFALGHLLYLTPEARVSSTFGGHYDFAAYLVFLMPIVLSVYIWKRNIVYFLIFFIGLLALVLTASRISSIAYLVSIISFLIFLRKPMLLILVVVLSIGMSFFSTNLTSRFLKTFQIRQIFVNEKTGQVVVPQKISSKELPAGSFYVQLKTQPTPSKESTPSVGAIDPTLRERILSDIREEASKSGKVLTATEEASLLARIYANLKPINTVVSDISLATRIQVEWPRAVRAFLRNPVFGTGPSSITEATDNDYLRWIGEIGGLGTILFLTILFKLVQFVWYRLRKLGNTDKILYYGFLFGIFGLILNATYIDVFEASKVAYQFW
ncbi:O-antigen ligase family protein, partial [Candidatus Roizmanbacteria bacterium]|nr:O-antigen ligase family protein [Candidatus Roizmanbacteria bacterium]